MMTGEYLEDAQAQRDPQFGQPIVTFELNRRGGRIFERATGEHVGDPMAIVLDEQGLQRARHPVADRQTAARSSSAAASIEEARDLALVLRAGALPAPHQDRGGAQRRPVARRRLHRQGRARRASSASCWWC